MDMGRMAYPDMPRSHDCDITDGRWTSLDPAAGHRHVTARLTSKITDGHGSAGDERRSRDIVSRRQRSGAWTLGAQGPSRCQYAAQRP